MKCGKGATMAGQPDASAAGTIDVGGDLTVNRMGFGALRVTFIDTAASYGPEASETLIADTLYPYPGDLVIATKGGLLRPGPGRWQPDGRPEHLREACEGSLRRLRLEQIPLLQLHRPDPRVRLEDSVGAVVQK